MDSWACWIVESAVLMYLKYESEDQRPIDLMRWSSMRALAADVAAPIRKEWPVIPLSECPAQCRSCLSISRNRDLVRALPFSMMNNGSLDLQAKVEFLMDKYVDNCWIGHTVLLVRNNLMSIPLRNGSVFDCFKVRTAWLSCIARSLKHRLHSGSNDDLQVNSAHLRNPKRPLRTL